MTINYLGIVAAIIAFISLFLPWWTMTMTREIGETKVSGDVSVYTYDARMTIKILEKESRSIVDDFSIWYSYVALALIVIAGVTGIVGSLIVGKNGKMILSVAGILALLSIIIFAVGLQLELPDLTEEVRSEFPDYPEIILMGTGSFTSSDGGTTIETDYLTVLFIGFWLAAAAGFIALIASDRHPMAPPVAPTPPTPAPAVPPEPKVKACIPMYEVSP